MPKLTWTVPLLVVVAAGCEALSGPAAVRIRTSAASYQLGASIVYTAANTGSESVYLASCCGGAIAALDRWDGGSWSNYRSGACLALCPMVPIEVTAGRSYAGTVSLSDTGVYRVHLGVATAWGAQPDWSAVSNAFEVR